MGIRFECSHCQRRLNVKTIQAGQEGQCPHCREVVRVPLESAISSPKRKRENAQQKASRFIEADVAEPEEDPSTILDADEQITLDGPLAGEHSAIGLKSKAEPRFKQKPQVDPEDAFMLGRPSPAPHLGRVDPIQEAPKKVWYFRTRGFGERGPIKANIMQKHLDAGDVQVGSVVWREDWDDWIDAEDVFPALAAEAKEQKQQARLAKAIRESEYDLPDELTELAIQRQRRQTAIFAIISITGLTIVALLVLAVLFLFRS